MFLAAKISLVLSFSLSSHAGALVPMTPAQLHVTPVMMVQGRWVDHCEEDGQPDPWAIDGPKYFGGLGWRSATWATYRLSWMPFSMNLATPLEQTWALYQFAKVNGMPDLGGTCHGY